jgi:hypothetical protein
MKMKDNDTVSSDFVDALTLIDEAERAYLDLNQLTQSSPEFTEPEAFCRNILKDIFRTANLTDHAAQRKLLVWACDQRAKTSTGTLDLRAIWSVCIACSPQRMEKFRWTKLSVDQVVMSP